MKIERATTEDVLAVASNMRDRDLEEFSAVMFADTREGLARLLAEHYGGREDVFCGADGHPICIGGSIETRPNVVTLVFFATDEFPRIALPITRFVRRELFPRYFAAGVHRIEAVSLATYSPIHEWLRTLGLSQETGPMLGYGKRGESFIQFSLVQNVRPAGR